MKDGTSYRLGPKLLTLGEYIRNRADVYRAAKDQIETLAEDTGESAHLIIEHDGNCSPSMSGSGKTRSA